MIKTSTEGNESEKRKIGLYGEMRLAMELHDIGWQVYRAYIDDQIDFIIARYYCRFCKEFSTLQKKHNGSKVFLTNRCATCDRIELKFIVRFLQVKTSEGIKSKSKGIRQYSFHAKLRNNVDDRAFYVWIALVGERRQRMAHYYVFGHEEISKFDNLELASYQVTDNQKTTLSIREDGLVTKKGKIYDYSCFNNEFYGSFEKFNVIHNNE